LIVPPVKNVVKIIEPGAPNEVVPSEFSPLM